ncbi:ubiquitin fusion degradation protein UFD1-domain-containing protein [Morchella snyderi]|nr:ubiquitin fusion degradation protein UFD1-domain-containing protein [Morchella snyderi]
MFGGNFYEEDDGGISYGGGRGSSRPTRRYDEYLRCYPVIMMAGNERENVNYGGKVIMPPSALDKLTRLHIAYPMLFELKNGAKGTGTHAGVLEFIAEEGRVYLPHWMMNTLLLESGDLLQIKSTDLPSGTFIKLQPQSVSFLESITDPKAVLENALRNFSALTKGDTFSFLYNEQVFEINVLEVKPETPQGAISCVETDLEVDFAPPLDYVEPVRMPRSTGSSRPGSIVGGGRVTPLGVQEGSMARSLNYAAIAPGSSQAAASKSSYFSGGGQKLKGSKTSTPRDKPSTPVAGTSTNKPPPTVPTGTVRKGSGPQPLRVPRGTLFFGYEIKPVKKKDEEKEKSGKETLFSGAGQTLRAAANAKKGKGKGKGGPDVIEID